jgi:hydroxyethylthiazole kinase-like uncharacterized protein yjeF
MKLVSVEEMRRIEQLTDESGQSYDAMMERAGNWVATAAMALRWPQMLSHVLVLVGPGNNGGDGLVAAHYLREAECEVTLYIWKRDPKGDHNLSRLKRRRRGVTILWADNDPDFVNLRKEVQGASLIVDALLGTGVARPLGGKLAELLGTVKQELAALEARPAAELFPKGLPRWPLAEALGGPETLAGPLWDFDDDLRDAMPPGMGQGPDLRGLAQMVLQGHGEEEWDDLDEDQLLAEDAVLPKVKDPWPLVPVVAVDCPTGLNCDTGALDEASLAAALTITFAYPKYGHVQYPGAGACGILQLVDIGVPAQFGADLPVELMERSMVREWLPPRPDDANKGTFGKAMIAGGSLLYTGAPALSASAAAHTGAGLVTLAVPKDVHPILAGSLLEITWLPLAGIDGVHSAEGVRRLIERLKGYNALLVGPGLTTEPSAAEFLEALLGPDGLDKQAWQGRTVFDADALNLLAKMPRWHTLLPPRSVLTPHPGEMGRLTGMTAAEINASRIANARRYAAEWGHIVLLKGAHTVIAHPDGRAAVLPFAEAALAKAGSGDVLAGVIVAMLAQGLDAFRAATVGGFVHALAGVDAGATMGAAAVTARELLTALPDALLQIVSEP